MSQWFILDSSHVRRLDGANSHRESKARDSDVSGDCQNLCEHIDSILHYVTLVTLADWAPALKSRDNPPCPTNLGYCKTKWIYMLHKDGSINVNSIYNGGHINSPCLVTSEAFCLWKELQCSYNKANWQHTSPLHAPPWSMSVKWKLISSFFGDAIVSCDIFLEAVLWEDVFWGRKWKSG